MYKVVQTKSLNKCFRYLKKCGKKGKDAITKTRSAQSEAATEGEIQSLKRTNHGESRLANAEKYDLGNGYRLVVQLVDGVSKTRAFVFAGSHDDTEDWLDGHRDYKWVKSDKDDTLNFIQVTESKPEQAKIVSMDLDSSEMLRELPLLRHVSNDEWKSLGFTDSLKEYCLSITADDWECDPNGILDYVENSSEIDAAILIDDLLSHSHKLELQEMHKRISLYSGSAMIADGENFRSVVSSPSNSEIFVTWDEVAELPDDSSWSDWLLFLHPEQKELSIKDFNGPARLRGVSGSGKTCVMLHRARYLAKKYRQPILLVTLTESMRKLLDSLIAELCGVEASLIETSTIQGLAHRIITEVHPKGESAYRKNNNNTETATVIQKKIVEYVKSHKHYASTGLSKLPFHEQNKFIEEEIYFIRSRLLNSDFSKYLDSKVFKRHGRKIALRNEARTPFYDAAKLKAEKLKEIFDIDYEGAVAAACSLLLNNSESIDSFGWAQVDPKILSEKIKSFSPYRCVLVDEVQDLSQLEVTMVAALRAGEDTISNQENGLFLVGDGAQTIYNKGFVLKQCGVNVSNRSYVLKKNYRNSKEIMEASYALIEKYEFADVDEDNIVKPTKPDLPSAVGEKPFVVKCRSEADEVQFVCEAIQKLLEVASEDEEQDRYPEICVIGLNKRIRESISRGLKLRSIVSCELKQTLNIEGSNSIKISTIESAKGHEFQHVFILGVVEGAMPNKSVETDNISREASRLYVAMTRARETLYITYNISDKATPSRFLVDIQDYVNEYDCKELLQLEVMY